jgi:hypothetical protein
MSRRSRAHMTHLFNVENPNWEKTTVARRPNPLFQYLYTWDVTKCLYPLTKIIIWCYLWRDQPFLLSESDGVMFRRMEVSYNSKTSAWPQWSCLPCLVDQGVYVVFGLVDRGKEQAGTKHYDMKMAAWIVNDRGAFLFQCRWPCFI